MSGLLRVTLFFAVFLGACLSLMEPALRAPFLSDDQGYIQFNQFVHRLSAENLMAILDPFGQPARNTANYAPIHLLTHAVEWRVFGREMLGWHVANLVMHALCATLLVELLVARGLSLVPAGIAGALFALHPANVEAVVWISQLKTLLALAFALGALIAHPRIPWLGSLLFALALLSKIQAMFALPVALAWTWLACHDASSWRERARWLYAWGAIALICALPQMIAFQRSGEIATPLGADPLERLRTLFAIGARYLAMAYAGYGTSPFHEPDAARGLDPWWLAGVALAMLFGRLLWTSLRQRREEAAWWLWAAVAYAPVCQVFPFLFPMGDRYLYFVLPGLVGGTIFAVRDAWPRLETRFSLPERRTLLRGATALAALLAVGFSVGARSQARVWRSSSTLALASAQHYPNGSTARRMRAYQAAKLGDVETAAAELHGAVARGFDRFMDVYDDPAYVPIREHPAFDAVLREMAGNWIATIRARAEPTHYELYWTARAYVMREEYEAAERAYRDALRIGGEFDEMIHPQLGALRSYLEKAGARAEPGAE